MKIRTREIDGVVELLSEGNLLQENVDLLKNRLNDLIEERKVEIVLSLQNTYYISSLCLSTIVNAKIRLNEKNGDIKLSNVNSLIKSLLEITNLVKKLEVFDTTEDAVKSF